MMARPMIVLTAGINGSTFRNFTTILMNERPTLLPGDAFEKTVTVDVGEVRRHLLRHIDQPQPIELTAVLDPVFEDGQLIEGMSLMGDAISHAVLPGLVIAFLITHSRGIGAMLIGAVVVGILTALLTQMVARYGKVEEGAAMGVVFTILFAIGLVLIRRATDHVDLDPSCVLYGNIAHIYADAFHGTPVALKNLAIVFALNLVFVVAFYKELKVSAFDPGLSSTLGINANLMTVCSSMPCQPLMA